MLQFSAPRRVRNFDSQHPTGELNRPRAACNRRSAGQRPSQQGGLGARRFSQAAGNYFFHIWRDWVHGSFDFNIRKGLWDCSKLSDYARVELESDPAGEGRWFRHRHAFRKTNRSQCGRATGAGQSFCPYIFSIAIFTGNCAMVSDFLFTFDCCG